MKAWIADNGNPADGCLLVFAETRNKAKYVASRNSFGMGFLDEYEYISCRRRPGFDKWYRGYAIIETNNDLPDGCPKFYIDDEMY